MARKKPTNNWDLVCDSNPGFTSTNVESLFKNAKIPGFKIASITDKLETITADLTYCFEIYDSLKHQSEKPAPAAIRDELKALHQKSKSYLSALEHGKKGKPSEKLIRCIDEFFSLNKEQAEALNKAAQVSSPSLKIPNDSGPNVYWVGHLFTERAKYLSEQDLNIIELLLNSKRLSEGNGM